MLVWLACLRPITKPTPVPITFKWSPLHIAFHVVLHMSRLMSSVVRRAMRPAGMMRSVHMSHALWSPWHEASSAASSQCTASGTVRLRQGDAAWATERDAWHAYSMAKAAAMLAAKRARWDVPMHVPISLDHIEVWIEPLEWVEEMPSETPEAPSRDDGGFSAESLMDPDAWMARQPRQCVSETSKIPKFGAIRVACRTNAHVPTHTEAMAGCLSGCLSLCDAVHAHTGYFPTIEHVHTVAS